MSDDDQPKRGPGRPRKHPYIEPQEPQEPRKRGRPRKGELRPKLPTGRPRKYEKKEVPGVPGRPPGRKNDITIALAKAAAVAAEAGPTPLHMLLKGMVEFDERADELKTLILAAIEQRNDETVNRLLRNWFLFRSGAIDAAAKAAVYIHPKLMAQVTKDGQDVPMADQVPQLFVTIAKED